MEEVKRLAPKRAVLRELYLKSGNRCAFPGCNRSILNDQGVLIGDVCHIEAAMPGGPRFNDDPAQTNEDRRAFNNLVLLCHDHHLETDDEEKFPVTRMKEIKKEHEQKYGDVTDKLFSSIADKTELQEYQYCTTLKSYYEIMDWEYLEDEVEGNANVFNQLVDDLRDLSPETRAVFKIMLQRQKLKNKYINITELPLVTGVAVHTISMHIRMLEEKNFIVPVEDNERGMLISDFVQWEGQWDIWRDIREYASRSGITLEELIDNMNFSLLD